MKKTNAMRILDQAKIPYTTEEYDDDGEHVLERGAAERLSKKLGIDPEFDKMNFIPEKKNEPIKKKFFIADRIEHLDDDRYGNGGKTYSYFPYKEEKRYVDDEGKLHEETYIFTFDTLENALKVWKKNPMFDALGLYL